MHNDYAMIRRTFASGAVGVLGAAVGVAVSFALLMGYAAFTNANSPDYVGARFGMGVFKALSVGLCAVFLILPGASAHSFGRIIRVDSAIALVIAAGVTAALVYPAFWLLSGVNSCAAGQPFPLGGVWFCGD